MLTDRISLTQRRVRKRSRKKGDGPDWPGSSLPGGGNAATASAVKFWGGAKGIDELSYDGAAVAAAYLELDDMAECGS